MEDKDEILDANEVRRLLRMKELELDDPMANSLSPNEVQQFRRRLGFDA